MELVIAPIIRMKMSDTVPFGGAKKDSFNAQIIDVSMKLPNAIKLMIVEILAMKRDVLVRILTTCSDVQRVHALAKTKGATSCQIAKMQVTKLDVPIGIV
jgi:hypothetical protein